MMDNPYNLRSQQLLAFACFFLAILRPFIHVAENWVIVVANHMFSLDFDFQNFNDEGLAITHESLVHH